MLLRMVLRLIAHPSEVCNIAWPTRCCRLPWHVDLLQTIRSSAEGYIPMTSSNRRDCNNVKTCAVDVEKGIKKRVYRLHRRSSPGPDSPVLARSVPTHRPLRNCPVDRHPVGATHPTSLELWRTTTSSVDRPALVDGYHR